MSTFEFGVGLFPTEPLQKMIHLAKVSEEVGLQPYLGRRLASHLARSLRQHGGDDAQHDEGQIRHRRDESSYAPSLGARQRLRDAGRICAGTNDRRHRPGRQLGGNHGLETVDAGQLRKVLGSKCASCSPARKLQLPSGKIHLLHPCKGKVPIYIAASGPKMLELSGRIADGIIVLVGVADEYIAHAKEKIAVGAKAAGRKLADINLVLWVPCAVSDTAPAKDAVKAHVARVVAHPLPYVLDPNEQKVLEEIRKTYDYYHHMDQQANHAEVIPDWLVDKFAIAGTVDQCRAQIERIKKTGIQQIAIIPYSPPGGSREETIRGFAKAMS